VLEPAGVPDHALIVPCTEAAHLEEPLANRGRHVLVDPRVPHLVEQHVAGDLAHDHDAHVDATAELRTQVAVAAGRVGVEVDVDRRGLETRVLVPAERPANQPLVLGVRAEHADPLPHDDWGGPGVCVDAPAGQRRGRQDQDEEPRCDLRAHVGRVELRSWNPVAFA
jgi:hypothetical protein